MGCGISAIGIISSKCSGNDWRIPDLQPNTTQITLNSGLKSYSDNSLTSPLNLIYSEQRTDQLEYFLYFTDVRLGLGLKKMEKDFPISQKYRSFNFSGNTSDIIAYKFEPLSCYRLWTACIPIRSQIPIILNFRPMNCG